jgi:DNA-binding transcriptional MerR regulator
LAQDLPREYQEITASLKRCGASRIYGVFGAEDWRRAAVDAGLYLVGINWSTARVAEIRKAAEDFSKAMDEASWLERWRVGDPVKATIRFYMERGLFLQSLFPDGSGLQPESSDTAQIRVYYPRPNVDDLRAIHSARLSGLTVGIAAPPEALSVEINDLIADVQSHVARKRTEDAIRKRELARAREQARERAREQARIDADPIVFGTDGTHTVVLGHYNTSENDPEELRSLVATLDTLAFDL